MTKGRFGFSSPLAPLPRKLDALPHMARLEIACSHCGQRLKVPDLSVLGRKARCGKCGKTFVMQPTALRSDERPERSAGESFRAPIEFAELQSGRWSAATGEPQSRRSAPGDRSTSAGPPITPVEGGQASLAAEGPALLEGIELFPVVESDAELLSRRTVRRSKRGQGNTLIAAGSVLILAATAAAYFLFSPSRSQPKAIVSADSPEPSESPAVEASAHGRPGHAQAASPTHGEPIALRYVPMGARVVAHLRLADLWQSGGPGEEFRACLGPLGVWLDAQLRGLCLSEPANVETLLVALIPASRETFDTCAVVRFKGDVKRSELLEKINGELVDEPRTHYVTATSAYFFPDAHTMSVAPRGLATAMIEAASAAGAPSEGIEALLPRTDRERHFALLADLEDVRNGMPSLATESARGLVGAIVEFFGENVETVAVLSHLGDAAQHRDFHTQILLRNRGTQSPQHLRDALQKRFAALPSGMRNIVSRANPHTRGEKKILDRFPDMLTVLEQSSTLEASRRLVAIDCRLPERAAPNLALGARLAWSETTRPEYGRAPLSATAPPPNRELQPATIAQRLQKPIDVEFRDDFLFVAIAYIGEETGVEFKLDGAGMKRAGVTQNEKQKFKLDKTPAIDILDRILTPRKLVLIVDEQAKIATITGAEEAADKKLQPFRLKSANAP